jgi:Mlc titration factor MtfA (ptsG expression regulator)
MGRLIFVLAVCAGIGWLVSRNRRLRRRKRLLKTPIAVSAQESLERREINLFLHDKRFVGCGGYEVGDETRLIVAAEACLLLLNRKTSHFSTLKTILIYPDSFVVNEVTHDGMIATSEEQARSGESWHRGPVVLSWADIERDLAALDGRNVVLHEFAHQLDQEDGRSDGAPVLAGTSNYADWSRVLGDEYMRLRERVERDESTLIDPYGASAPGEFFAVVTEVFFELPAELQCQHPALYQQMQRFYNVDPANWTG